MGRLGGGRAVVRVRHRRAVRVRRRERRRLPRRRADRRAARPGDRRDHRGRPDLPHRRPAASRGQPGAAGAVDRRLPARTTSSGASPGNARRSPRRGSSPATPHSAGASRALAEEFVYERPMTDDDVREIRRMKARIERERIPPGEDPQFHLKLGPRLAVRRRVHRAAAPARPRRRASRAPGTGHDRRARPPARRRAPRRRRTPTCSRSRTGSANGRATLATCRPASRPTRFPAIRAELERLALLLGYVHQPNSTLRDDYRRVTRRARRVVERVFYGT